MSERLVLSEDDLYKVLSFLVSSAHLCVVEPKLYGTFRLIDAASRLTESVLQEGQLPDDEFLSTFKAETDKGAVLLMTDEQAYIQYLEDMTRMLAKEMKRRSAG
ncbi:DUF6092 family protein [Chloroflexota bacterium]